jgi:hypothetical protein
VLGYGAGHQRSAAALDGHVGPGVAAQPQHLGHFVGRTGADEGTGPAAITTGVVDTAAGQHVWIGADMIRPHQRRHLLQHTRGHGLGLPHARRRPSDRPASVATDAGSVS